jgi:ASC-1-like (ASCH) protein
MQIHLDPEIYEQVKNGTKNVEARVNDEKRQRLKIGDIIEVLKRPEETESLNVRVTGLKYFSDFTELADNYPIERMYSASFTKAEYVALFPKFYSDDEIIKYGTVAIEFEVIDE